MYFPNRTCGIDLSPKRVRPYSQLTWTLRIAAICFTDTNCLFICIIFYLTTSNWVSCPDMYNPALGPPKGGFRFLVAQNTDLQVIDLINFLRKSLIMNDHHWRWVADVPDLCQLCAKMCHNWPKSNKIDDHNFNKPKTRFLVEKSGFILVAGMVSLMLNHFLGHFVLGRRIWMVSASLRSASTTSSLASLVRSPVSSATQFRHTIPISQN